jgi:two-component system response regulator AtoC
LTCSEGASNGDASVGTIFLDEVSQLDLATQRRLLQLLPEGDTPALRARLISSTTQNLDDQMRAGQFRDELYYRINGVCLRLPPLRHRAVDIPVLLDFFLKKYAALFGRLEPHVGTATMDVLLRHPWPGNIRELENFARKIVALGDEHLALSDLPTHVSSVVSETSPVRVGPSVSPGNGAGNGRSLKEAAREASRKTEHEMILRVLQRTHWNRKRTARELQISYKALLYKLKQLGLNGDSEEPAR